MLKRTYLSPFFLLFLLFFIGNLETQAQNYTAEWKIIDSLHNRGLPESAMKETEKLLEIIRKDSNNKNQVAQFIRTLIYFNKFQSQLEEEGLANAIFRFQSETEKATGITKAIMQSMLAEMYYQYLQNHYYKFQNRTAAPDYKSEDIATWDIPRLTHKIFELYSASIQGDAIKKVKLGDYKDLLNSSSFDTALQPTLFDLLMNRAITFFSNENSYLTQPAYKFYIEEPAALADAQTFVNHKFIAKDSLSNKFRTLLMFQEFMRFHLKDADPAALADADFRRLNWVYNHAIIGDKDERYVQALNNIAKKYASNPLAGEAAVTPFDRLAGASAHLK